MKKIITLLLISIMLVACTNKNTSSSLSDGDTVLFTGPDVTYTKNDLYQALKVSSSDNVTKDIMKNLAKLYQINTEDIEKEAQASVDEYVANGYESYIIAYYGSLDAFKETYVNGKLYDELARIYVNENFDALVQDDAPVKMQMAKFNELEDAQKCIDDVNNGSTFDTAALNNNSQASPESQVYTDSDTALAYEVKEYLNSTAANGLSSIITSTVTSTDAEGKQVDTNTYYVLNVESRNVEEFKDDYVTLAAINIDTDTLHEYLFNKHHIEFFDQDLYELMSKEYEVLK